MYDLLTMVVGRGWGSEEESRGVDQEWRFVPSSDWDDPDLFVYGMGNNSCTYGNSRKDFVTSPMLMPPFGRKSTLLRRKKL